MSQLDPQIVNVAELPQFLIAFRKDLEFFVERMGLDPALHFRYHEGQFDVKAIDTHSFGLPQVVLTVGEGRTRRTGGTLASVVGVAIYIITREEPDIPRDVAALFFVNELTRFLLRVEEWKNAQGLASVPQECPYENQFSDELDKKKLALWVMSFEPTVSITLNRNIARYPAFTMRAQALGTSQTIDPSASP